MGRRSAARCARKILADFSMKAPIYVKDIARLLNIDICTLPLTGNLSAALLPEEHGYYCIVVKASDSEERRNFSIAHEIGHWSLHRFLNRAFSCNKDTRGPLESEANAFAAELLMPKEAVFEMYQDGLSINDIALCLGVSRQAVEVRIRVIGCTSKN